MRKNSVIAQITRDTHKICVQLVGICRSPLITWNDKGKCDLLDAKIHIKRAGCPPPPPAPMTKGCGYGYEEVPAPPPDPVPVIEYCAFDIAQNGGVCFYLDHLLLESKPGRYDATLFIGEQQCDSFQIHLTDCWQVAGVQTESRSHA